MAVGIALGHVLCGRWASVDGEGVRTRFLLIGLPLVPIESFYVVGRWPRPTRILPAKWSTPSVLIAYVRWILAPIAFVITVIASATDGARTASLEGHHAVAVGGAVLVWIGLVMLTGRAHGRAAAQRRLMKKYLGHAAAPELLTEGAAQLELDRLEEIWKAASAKDTPYREARAAVPWRDVFPKDVRNTMIPLYYALCRYDAAITRDEVRGNRARIVWERIEGAPS